MTHSSVRISIQNMFDPKFELDSHFGDAAPPPPKRKKGREEDLLRFHRWPETDHCREGMPLPSDHNVYSLLFPHFLKLLCRPITLLQNCCIRMTLLVFMIFDVLRL